MPAITWQQWQQRHDGDRAPTRADLVSYPLPCGAVAVFRAGRPFALVVERHAIPWEQLNDYEEAVTRIATMPDIRPAIRQARALADRMNAAPAAEGK